MFSGIIKGVGHIVVYDDVSHRLWIRCPLFSERIERGASIAVDGVCLTVCDRKSDDANVFGFDLGEETRKLTLLATKAQNSLVNIEFSLRLGDPIDGHIVQGHVDGVATLVEKSEISGNLLLRFALTPTLGRFIVHKGGIALNGVSLTVNDVDHQQFSVCLVPYTVDNTNFASIAIGDQVHVETDIYGRYAHKFATSLYHDCSRTAS